MYINIAVRTHEETQISKSPRSDKASIYNRSLEAGEMVPQLKHLPLKQEGQSGVPRAHRSVRWVEWPICHLSFGRQREKILRASWTAKVALSGKLRV